MKKRTINHKKGQAFGELLMKLGGLILLLALVALVLIKMGIIQYDSSFYKDYIPKKCLYKTGLDCIDDAIITNQSMTLILKNEDKIDYKLSILNLTMVHPPNSSCVNPQINGSAAIFPADIPSFSNISISYSCKGLVSKDWLEAKAAFRVTKTTSTYEVVYNGKIIGEIS